MSDDFQGHFPKATEGKACWKYVASPSGKLACRLSIRVWFPKGHKMPREAFHAACAAYRPVIRPGWRRESAETTDPVLEDYLDYEATDVPVRCPHCGREN